MSGAAKRLSAVLFIAAVGCTKPADRAPKSIAQLEYEEFAALYKENLARAHEYLTDEEMDQVKACFIQAGRDRRQIKKCLAELIADAMTILDPSQSELARAQSRVPNN